jgi:hypothetical protein
MIHEGDCGAIAGMQIGRGNRSTCRKPTPVPLCPPQIPHDLTRAWQSVLNLHVYLHMSIPTCFIFIIIWSFNILFILNCHVYYLMYSHYRPMPVGLIPCPIIWREVTTNQRNYQNLTQIIGEYCVRLLVQKTLIPLPNYIFWETGIWFRPCTLDSLNLFS